MHQFFLFEITGGTMSDLHGPFTDEGAFVVAAQKIRDKQDHGVDSLFALQLADGALTEIPAPGDDDAVGCSTCGHPVMQEDPFFATPCGTYCSACMGLHAKECNVCAHEFDLSGPSL